MSEPLKVRWKSSLVDAGTAIELYADENKQLRKQMDELLAVAVETLEATKAALAKLYGLRDQLTETQKERDQLREKVKAVEAAVFVARMLDEQQVVEATKQLREQLATVRELRELDCVENKQLRERLAKAEKNSTYQALGEEQLRGDYLMNQPTIAAPGEWKIIDGDIHVSSTRAFIFPRGTNPGLVEAIVVAHNASIAAEREQWQLAVEECHHIISRKNEQLAAKDELHAVAFQVLERHHQEQLAAAVEALKAAKCLVPAIKTLTDKKDSEHVSGLIDAALAQIEGWEEK